MDQDKIFNITKDLIKSKKYGKVWYIIYPFIMFYNKYNFYNSNGRSLYKLVIYDIRSNSVRAEKNGIYGLASVMDWFEDQYDIMEKDKSLKLDSVCPLSYIDFVEWEARPIYQHKIVDGKKVVELDKSDSLELVEKN